MYSTRYLAAFAMVATITPLASAAPKKNAPKTATKTAQPKLIREVMGTTQLSGYEGKLGQTFTLGKDSPLNFTLNRLEYSVGRVNIGNYAHHPLGDEKMLILHFTVQNPTKRVTNFSASYLTFNAIDANGVTRNYLGDIAREVTAEPVQIALNPGQKIEAYTAIKVAAFGPVPKIIVRHAYETKAPILRYDGRGAAKKLTAPFGDPADQSGTTALKMVPVKSGTWYQVTDFFDAKLEKVDYATKIAEREAGTGKKYCVATFSIRNGGKRPTNYGQSFFRADLKDADGEKTDYNTSMLKGSRDEEASSTLAPGEEARVRFYWTLPENVDAQTVLLQYGYNREARTFAFPAK
ncbi:MAG TPA: DUF4352 domain-containing protein [Abditibacterium sp.]|jgi:hypothetical protein